jgi:hypothetical protein
LADSRSQITNLVVDEKYVFRLKYATATENSEGRPISITYQRTAPTFKAGIYSLNDGVYSITDVLFESASATYDESNHWLTYIVTCKKSLEYKELIKLKLGLFL